MKNRMLLKFLSALALVPSPVWAVDSALPSDVAMRDMGGGRLFVNADGLTLYTYKKDREQLGASTCLDECADIWPPVTTNADANPVGAWTIITRPDGTPQWAYRGEPIYTYVKDTHPGAMAGEKVSRSWDVLYEPIGTPPNVQIKATMSGQTFSDLNGHTVYTGPASDCDEACLKSWLPVEAPWLARPINDDWTIQQRTDGLLQWAYKEQPLYTFSGDFNNEDSNGVDSDGGWNVAVLQDAPGVPDWVTYQETDIGPVMATSDNMTLYTVTGNWEKIRTTTCNETCVDANWDPIIAPDNSAPIGNWSTRPLPDGQQQWTYLGSPVSTFKGDRIPGDTYGDKFGTGSDIRGGWGAILQESLIQNLVR